MRAGLSILLALPIALGATWAWMVAADHGSASVAVLGLGGSAGTSMLLARGRPRAPIPVADPFRAPPGLQPPQPRRPYLPARLAHAAYAWNLATFLGIEFVLLDGDVRARGIVWVALAGALLIHLVQAVALPQIIDRFEGT